ncbi:MULTISPECIES: hypothetical protein [Bacillus]|uniref:hypothetical protein n=1 Tax=Bacillus TaxID=1386 RepID=UPI000312DCD3|nr:MULTISPECIES: hypothetical protein [Bacillus]
MIITTLEQINKGFLALGLNLVYFLSIIIVGWYLTGHYNQLEYLYWTISCMNILGFVSMMFVLKVIRNEFKIAGLKESGNVSFMVQNYENHYSTEILKLFTESNFYFKTMSPKYLSEEEILNLVESETMIITSNNKVIGLVEFNLVMEAAKHYSIDFRFSNKLNIQTCSYILEQIIQAFTHKSRVIKLATNCVEFDDDYITLLKNIGFTIEGKLDNLIQKDDRSHAIIYFHKFITKQEQLELSQKEKVQELSRFGVELGGS